MFGEHDGGAQIVDESGKGRQHFLGGGRIECRCRLVEHKNLGIHGEHRADGYPLLLAARQATKRATAQINNAQKVESFLHPAAHDLRCDAQLLHTVGKFVLDDVGDKAGQRILADEADQMGEFARRMIGRFHSIDGDGAVEMAAGEMRDESVEQTKQGRLA